MKLLIPSNTFKRDAKKQWEILLSSEWAEVAYCLIHEKTLPEKYCDHDLKHNWQGFRECHIKPDMLLIYEVGNDNIQLVRLGSHAQLFG